MVDDLAGARDDTAGRSIADGGEERNLTFRVMGVLGFRVQGLAGVREGLEGGRGKVLGLRVQGLAGVGGGGWRRKMTDL
jgi:hypothetical protein